MEALKQSEKITYLNKDIWFCSNINNDFNSSSFSLLQVSLDSKVREIVNKNMVAPTANTFDEAQVQIYTLMHRDSYPRFVVSPLYRRMAQLSPPTPPTRKTSISVGWRMLTRNVHSRDWDILSDYI